jgi:predicted O-methyltransferase YrrM
VRRRLDLVAYRRRLRSKDPRLADRTDLLNFLALHSGARRYLEIGVRDTRVNFDRILVPEKDGVDPALQYGHIGFELTSDEFFALLDRRGAADRYDLVFVDGLHLADQVQRDVENSLRYLAPGGTIVMHDCNPIAEEHQIDEYDGVAHWNGTTWKAYVRLRARPDLDMCVVDIDDGCGVVRPGRQEPLTPPATLDWALLEARRSELLGLVSPEEFVRATVS